jgi:hypothetical protein
MSTPSSSSGSFLMRAPTRRPSIRRSNEFLNAPPATEPMVRDHAEVSRLAAKLLELRERLVYSYFGPAQLQSLRELLYDLHALIELHLAKEDEFRLTLLVRRIPAAESGVGA